MEVEGSNARWRRFHHAPPANQRNRFMEYIVLGKDGKEYGPVDGETLRKWVEHGRVQHDSQIRNALVRKWNNARDIDILQESFAVQEAIAEQEQSKGLLGGLLGSGQTSEKPTAPKEKSTAFKYQYVPDPVGPKLRIFSALTDMLVVGAFGAVIFLLMNISAGTLALGEFSLGWETESAAEKAAPDKTSTEANDASKGEMDTVDETEEPAAPEVPAWTQVPKKKIKTLNAIYPRYFTLFAIGALLYLGIGLGLFAQTVGMWFWGIILVKGHDEEAYPARAFAFAIAMLLMGFLSPLVTLINPAKRSVHEYLTGTRLIKVAAKPK